MCSRISEIQGENGLIHTNCPRNFRKGKKGQRTQSLLSKTHQKLEKVQYTLGHSNQGLLSGKDTIAPKAKPTRKHRRVSVGSSKLRLQFLNLTIPEYRLETLLKMIISRLYFRGSGSVYLRWAQELPFLTSYPK